MTWDLLLNLSPWLVILATLLWGALELRFRKLMDAKIEETKVSLRTEFQKPIGEVGLDAQRALEKAHEHDKQLAEMGVKVQFQWDDLARGAARVLREHRRSQDDDPR